MPSAASRRRVARLHVGLALAVVLCSTAFVIEVLRALGGNELSWAYVFEWPLLLCYAVFMWRRLVRDERTEATVAPEGRSATPVSPVPDAGVRGAGVRGAGVPAPSTTSERQRVEDEERDAWNAYLRELHAAERAGRSEPEPGS